MPKVIDLPTSTSMSDSDYLLMEASGGGTKKITKANARGTVPITQGGTGGTTFNGALANLGIHKTFFSSSSPKTLTPVSSSYRGLLFFHGTAARQNGIYAIGFNNTTGVPTVVPMIECAAVSFDTSVANKITISTDTSHYILLIDNNQVATLA